MTTDIFVFRKTGETRLAERGEWFIGATRRQPIQCEVEYTRCAAVIIKRFAASPEWLGHKGDPCNHCGQKADRVPMGPCRSFVRNGILTAKGESAVDAGRAQ